MVLLWIIQLIPPMVSFNPTRYHFIDLVTVTDIMIENDAIFCWYCSCHWCCLQWLYLIKESLVLNFSVGGSTNGTLMTTHDGSATKALCWAVAGINLREVATRLRNKMCQNTFLSFRHIWDTSATHMRKTINTLCIFHMLCVPIPQQDDRTSTLLQRLQEKTYFASQWIWTHDLPNHGCLPRHRHSY